MKKYKDLEEYRHAIAGDGEHAYDWSDKPHRLVYDLIRIASKLREESEKLKEQTALMRFKVRSRYGGDTHEYPNEFDADTLKDFLVTCHSLIACRFDLEVDIDGDCDWIITVHDDYD